VVKSGRFLAVRFLPPLTVLVAGLLVWQGWSMYTHVPAFLLPSPLDIWSAGLADRGEIGANAIPTCETAVLGFLLAVAAGLAIAIAIHFSRLLDLALYPLVIASQTVPVLALAPILLVLLGFTILPRLIIVALICFFPITVNAVDGFRSADPDLLRLMRSFGAGRVRTFWEVELPGSLPFVFSGAKVAVTFSVIGAIFGEYVGSSNGLGYLMTQKQAQFETGALFAAMGALTLIGICLFLAVSLAERILIPWYHDERRHAVHGR
jgi:ABC-type nitrate/sulfonate/bicarbonate transport system permease component